MPTYQYIVMDTYPLGNAAVALAKPGAVPSDSQACRKWMYDCEAAGTTLLVPAIAYYEGVRDLFQRQAFAKSAGFKDSALTRYGLFHLLRGT